MTHTFDPLLRSHWGTNIEQVEVLLDNTSSDNKWNIWDSDGECVNHRFLNFEPTEAEVREFLTTGAIVGKYDIP